MNPPPCVIHEDDHLLVVDKPAGWNTHAPSPFSCEGVYEWLRDREPRWAGLSIIHRLDKETSGLIIFGKTRLANVSLSSQFENRLVDKCYHLLARNRPVQDAFEVRTRIIRTGDRYQSRETANSFEAVTHFRVLGSSPEGWIIEAKPKTGRTHQIRVHASESGFPILGDELYGGETHARVCLHSHRVILQHPLSGELTAFESRPKFQEDPAHALRRGMVVDSETSAFRLCHGAGDDREGWFLDKLDSVLLLQGESLPTSKELAWLMQHPGFPGGGSVFFKTLNRKVRQTSPEDASPRLLCGPAIEHGEIKENGLKYRLGFHDGYSVGIFLDQRENRRRCLAGHVSADFGSWKSSAQPTVLNTFAYTCGFSVAAAAGGARTLSLDLSKKYLDWGRANFRLNGLDPEEHDFVFGDAFDWMRRFARKQRKFDLVILDPPTFSQSRESGVFRASEDYDKLVRLAIQLVSDRGVLLASCNTASIAPEDFLEQVKASVGDGGRKIGRIHYAPQPPDFPVNRKQPAYLKTVWIGLE